MGTNSRTPRSATDRLTFRRREFKGSRLRCLQLTSLNNGELARFLTALAQPPAIVRPHHFCMPRGMLAPKEAQLGKSDGFLDESDRRSDLLDWWLAAGKERASTPNWDIVAECEIDNQEGLLLLEAKAHPNELNDHDACDAGEKNRPQIVSALEQAQDELNRLIPGWHFCPNSHYQLSNRFAWAWKIASMGVPVVLIYLGFLDATEMITDSRDIFRTPEDWEKRVRDYSKDVIPGAMWNNSISIKGTSLTVLIRSARVTLRTEILDGSK